MTLWQAPLTAEQTPAGTLFRWPAPPVTDDCELRLLLGQVPFVAMSIAAGATSVVVAPELLEDSVGTVILCRDLI